MFSYVIMYFACPVYMLVNDLKSYKRMELSRGVNGKELAIRQTRFMKESS